VDLLALKGIVGELAKETPPLDPADAATIVSDAQAALTNVSGSTVRYQGVPEDLFGARLGLQIANLFYHRFASPGFSATVLSRVQSVYAAHPGGAGAMATCSGDRSNATGSLPPDYAPHQDASETNPCLIDSATQDAILVTCQDWFSVHDPCYNAGAMQSIICSLDASGPSWIVLLVSGSGKPDLYLRVVGGLGTFTASPSSV
jgi:hypothetical protein